MKKYILNKAIEGRICFIALLYVSIILLTASSAAAFSLGTIKVNSKFGERFSAEVVVDNDGKKGLEAAIGSKEDYAMLGLIRPDIANDVQLTIIQEPIPTDKQIIKLSSQKILFYPSFELIIKASLDGGVILEKYILAVDFRRNLSVSLSSDTDPPSKEKKPEGTEKVSASPPVKVSLLPDSIIIKDEPPLEKEKKEAEEDDAVVISPLRYGPVQIGESLFIIAKKLPFRNYSQHQIVTALWEINKDKFIDLNMNGLKKNTYLDYSGIEVALSKISHTDAFKIVDEHRFLWEGKSGLHGKRGNRRSLIPPPYEKDPLYKETIRKRILQWKGYWENKNIDGLMGLYSKDFKTGGKDWQKWREYKERFNARYHSITISIDKVETLRLKADDTIHSCFLQRFSSDEMKSMGLKTLAFKKEEGEWKITEEIWDNLRDHTRGPGSSPYVIHTASVAGLGDAIYETNRWRKLGYAAFYAFFEIPDRGGWYRIFVNRFSYKRVADRFADYIKKRGITQYALVMEMPYSLELEAYESEKEALQMLEKLRSENTIAPYVHRYKKDAGEDFLYKILIGAYAMKEQARKLSDILKDKGIEHRIAMQ